MRFLKSLGVIIETAVILVVGGIIVLLSLNLFNSDTMMNAVNFIYEQPNLRLVLGATGIILILVGLLSACSTISGFRPTMFRGSY